MTEQSKQGEAKPVAWIEGEESARHVGLQTMLRNGMMYSTRWHWDVAPQTSNPVWPIYAAPPQAAPAEQWAPMTDEQRARWKETGLFPVEKWKEGADSTPLVCPMPPNEELRALACAVPERLQHSGWYIGKPAFGHRYLYADNFRGMGRQWVCDFPSDKNYFGGLAEFVAAVHPRTVIRLLDRIAELEAQSQAAPVAQGLTPADLEALRDAVDDLDCELSTRYQGYPQDDRKRARDFAVVARARAILAQAAPSADEKCRTCGHASHLGTSCVNVAPSASAQQAEPDEDDEESDGAVMPVHWDLFPGWLIDHHEGDTITEELLQSALADMLKVHPAAPAPSASPAALTDERIRALVKEHGGIGEPGDRWDNGFSHAGLLDFARALLAASAAGQVGWQPIETAPKDGTVIDLWVGGDHRRTSCYWGRPHHCCGEMGSYCDSEWHDLVEGWVGDLNEPLGVFTAPTHWMPLPPSPAMSATPPAAEGEK